MQIVYKVPPSRSGEVLQLVRRSLRSVVGTGTTTSSLGAIFSSLSVVLLLCIQGLQEHASRSEQDDFC